METAYRLFRKYFISTILILLLFLVLNITLIVGVLLFANSKSSDSEIPVQTISQHISVDETGKITADSTASRLLSEKQAWAMLLNDAGAVIWQKNLPDDLPLQYTATDIAKFSRWYLKEYPTYVQEHTAGLLVVGGTPDSLVKWNYTMDTQYASFVLAGIVFVVTANIFLVLLLFWRNTHKIEKAITPVLQGIESISAGQKISLSEKGELAEINHKLNTAGTHLLKKEQARAEWINGISHDIRTPLSMVLGYAEEIEENHEAPDEVRIQAGSIKQQGLKLRNLITDLNLASKLEYSMQPLHVETIYPLELVRQVISHYLNGETDDTYSFELTAEPGAEMMIIQGDPPLLKRALDNLIGNAIKHNPDGCGITVQIKRHHNLCQIYIADDGAGMTDEQLKTLNQGIFPKKEYQATGETAHGLGLKLVRQIVQAHNGTLCFEQRTPHGLTICISIPMKQ